MKARCEHCEHLHVDTIATAPEGAALRLAGQTINDRVRNLHRWVALCIRDWRSGGIPFSGSAWEPEKIGWRCQRPWSRKL